MRNTDARPDGYSHLPDPNNPPNLSKTPSWFPLVPCVTVPHSESTSDQSWWNSKDPTRHRDKRRDSTGFHGVERARVSALDCPTMRRSSMVDTSAQMRTGTHCWTDFHRVSSNQRPKVVRPHTISVNKTYPPLIAHAHASKLMTCIEGYEYKRYGTATLSDVLYILHWPSHWRERKTRSLTCGIWGPLAKLLIFWVPQCAPKSDSNDPETILRTAGTNTQARVQISRINFALATRTYAKFAVLDLEQILLWMTNIY